MPVVPLIVVLPIAMAEGRIVDADFAGSEAGEKRRGLDASEEIAAAAVVGC